MKRKFIGGFAVLAIAAMAAWNVNYGSQTKGMSDVMLANVEALAQEIGIETGCPTGCLPNGSGCFCYQWYDCEEYP